MSFAILFSIFVLLTGCSLLGISFLVEIRMKADGCESRREKWRAISRTLRCLVPVQALIVGFFIFSNQVNLSFNTIFSTETAVAFKLAWNFLFGTQSIFVALGTTVNIFSIIVVGSIVAISTLVGVSVLVVCLKEKKLLSSKKKARGISCHCSQDGTVFVRFLRFSRLLN